MPFIPSSQSWSKRLELQCKWKAFLIQWPVDKFWFFKVDSCQSNTRSFFYTPHLWLHPLCEHWQPHVKAQIQTTHSTSLMTHFFGNVSPCFLWFSNLYAMTTCTTSILMRLSWLHEWQKFSLKRYIVTLQHRFPSCSCLCVPSFFLFLLA